MFALLMMLLSFSVGSIRSRPGGAGARCGPSAGPCPHAAAGADTRLLGGEGPGRSARDRYAWTYCRGGPLRTSGVRKTPSGWYYGRSSARWSDRTKKGQWLRPTSCGPGPERSEPVRYRSRIARAQPTPSRRPPTTTDSSAAQTSASIMPMTLVMLERSMA